MGSSIYWNIYSGNALTLGIYAGDPSAPNGSQGRQLYNKGIRRTGLGILLSYTSYVLVGVVCKKTVKVFGERGQYVTFHVVFIVCLTTLTLFRTDEFYFLSCVAAGVFRPCAFGLSYTLANHYVNEKAVRISATESVRNKMVSQTLALLGTLMPLEYLITASLMGPLMSLTGDVWVPIISGVVWATASLVVFVGLLFDQGRLVVVW